MASPTNHEKQKAVFNYLFGNQTGYMCVTTISRTSSDGEKKVRERFFDYPDKVDEAIDLINRSSMRYDVYFCAHLLNINERIKANAQPIQALWSDLDTCPQDKLLVPPTLVFKTSNDKLQAFWKLKDIVPPADAERVNKKIASYHSDEGADKSGWDLTQLLRVPYTYNHKYGELEFITVPTSKVDRVYTLEDFDVYPEVEESGYTEQDIPFPDDLPNKSAEQILKKYQQSLNPRVIQLYSHEPREDWSRALWELELSLMESEIPLEEAFIVVRDASCNKYARDNRPMDFLWKELVRAYNTVQERRSTTIAPSQKSVSAQWPETNLSPILSNEERESISDRTTIVEDYIEWAKGTGDAAWQYHQAGVFTVLSTLLTGRVRLPTSFGIILPNMWFMILGDTTLTRKSTAMDIAVDLLVEVDPGCMLATDGSIEGLLTSLSTRPGRPSLFLRDEFTGLMEMINKKDYYAGMLEVLTKLYDGKYQKRVLRKETIEIKDPIVNVFAGGIKGKTMELLDERYVRSGFVPRFCFVMADTDLTRMKPVGPPTNEGLAERIKLYERFKEIHEHYWQTEKSDDGSSIILPRMFNAELTKDAWARYNAIESQMVSESLDSFDPDLITPCMDRMAKSGLKAAVLIAASRSLGERVLVSHDDIIHGFYYVEQWRENTLDIVSNIGTTAGERKIESILNHIHRFPGSTKSDIMRRFKLTSRNASEMFDTLEQRGLVTRELKRKAGIEKLWPREVEI